MQFPPSPASILLLALLLITVPLVLVYALRARTAAAHTFRPLPGVARLRALFSDVAESGKPIHVATGANLGSIAASTPSAETIASLLIAQRVAEETTRRGGNVAATSGDLATHAALRGVTHQAYRRAGFGSEYRADNIQLVAHNAPTAYAAGVAARYRADDVAASVVAGNYGAEALLITEEGVARNVPQVAAASSLAALPVLALSADATLIGEELFAVEAYLSDAAAPKARLQTHDALRWVLLVLLIAGLVWQLVAPSLGLPVLG